MFRRLLVVCVLIQCPLGFAHAADTAGNYAIWGVGRASCHQYLKSADSTKDERYKLFLMGYLTAFNTLSDDTYNALGAVGLDEALKELSGYCGDHQMDSFDRAIQQIVQANFDARHRAPPGSERGWGRAAPKSTETDPPILE